MKIKKYVIVKNHKGFIHEVDSDLLPDLLKKGFVEVKMTRSEVPNYGPSRIVNFSFPVAPQYAFDGYGRLVRYIASKISPDRNKGKSLFFGIPVPAHKHGSATKQVLFTMFEADRIPQRWVDICNTYFDHLIVPSEFCVDVFKKCGVKTPITKMPLFTSNFEIYEKPTGPFVFAHQNSFVEGSQKGWDVTIRAFLHLFKGNKDVRLLLKGREHHWANVGWYYEELKKAENIDIVVKDYTDQEMHDKFYKNIHCFVFPSRGEGWGLPPLEAMAHGIPTILTKAHSHTEFSHYANEVEVNGSSYSFYVGRVFDSGVGAWVEPSIASLETQMKRIYDRYDAYKEKAIKNVPALQKNFNGDLFIKRLVDFMDSI